MESREYVTRLFLTNPDVFDLFEKIIRPVHSVIKSITKNSNYALKFDSTTRSKDYFRTASAYRYNKITEVGEEKLRDRYCGLNFKVFCFVGPYLTTKQISSIADESWKHVVQHISAHVRKIKLPDEFPAAAMKALGGGLGDDFKREWDSKIPGWRQYEELFQVQTKQVERDMKQRLGDIAKRALPFDEIAQCVAWYKSQHITASVQVLRGIRDWEKLNEWGCQVEETVTRVETKLKRALEAAARDGRSFDNLLDETMRLVENLQSEVKVKGAEFLEKAIEAPQMETIPHIYSSPAIPNACTEKPNICPPSNNSHQSILPSYSQSLADYPPGIRENGGNGAARHPSTSTLQDAQLSKDGGIPHPPPTSDIPMNSLPTNPKRTQSEDDAGQSSNGPQFKRLRTDYSHHSNPIVEKWRGCMAAGKVELFTKFDSTISDFCFALREVTTGMQFKCVTTSENPMGPIVIAPLGIGIFIYLTHQSPWHLRWWLEKTHGEVIPDMQGYVLDGNKLFRYLNFWLAPVCGDKIHFEGVLGKTGQSVVVQKTFGEWLFVFNDIFFNRIGRIIVKRVIAQKEIVEEATADE